MRNGIGTLDATSKVPRHTSLTRGEHRGSRHHYLRFRLLGAAAKKWGPRAALGTCRWTEVHSCFPPPGQAVPNCRLQIRCCPLPQGLPGAQPRHQWLPRSCLVRSQAGSKPPRLNQPDLLAHNSSLTHSDRPSGEDRHGEETATTPHCRRDCTRRCSKAGGGHGRGAVRPSEPREHPAEAGDQTSLLPPPCHPGPGRQPRLPAVTTAVSPPVSALVSAPLHATARLWPLLQQCPRLWSQCLTRVFHSTLQICTLYYPDSTPQKLQSSHQCKNLISRGHIKLFALKSVFPNINV